MEIHLTLSQILNILQLLGLPLLYMIILWLKKVYRGFLLNEMKHDSLVYALQLSLQNGFTEFYEKKLTELKDNSNWVENKR